MIAYAIQAARSSRLFDRIVVSTDSPQVAKISQKFGAEAPFFRPPELAGDSVPTVPVIRHAIRACQGLGWRPRNVCCVYPCNPLLSGGQLVAAYKMLQKKPKTYVFPVVKIPKPIQFALGRTKAGLTYPLKRGRKLMRTQDFRPAYHDAGQYYWGCTNTWNTKTNIHKKSVSVVIPPLQAIDIDTKEDWEQALLAFKILKKK